MTQTSPSLIYRRDGHIARIHFNRPEALNAIDAAMARDFKAACTAISTDPEVRVVVLSGEGRAFIAGGDIKEFQADAAGVAATLIDPLHEGVLLLSGLRAPVIASLRGPVAGAGFSLAMICDLAIAADDTRFNLAYCNLATTSDLGASWTLPRVVGLRKATEIALLSGTIDAAEALRLGLVNRVVAKEELEEQTEALATRLARQAPIAMGKMKKLLRESFANDLATQLAAERQSFAECARTADFAEAVDAFLGKRAANYTGR
ncbi:2-(1,2-epoxy-1,2-dihydrophenyl)acetyl-CoA isomerase [Steroidobacter denitrificans]|uniref:2-(1,2-epoxy-1,2-dihydrophenyl)acetyl-CoA isomerase n=1 Tax=Steroidobacter denitrificans TaxID=465721 RepID=A0A127FBY2_STEDE|nr:enoyl-CoA hydratase-related protein [Steroidobacter denitrificans]AMN47917.1 2-(1,2-epoxy-1,2-dihydrophenyl)acetyl-CoA isomerase [Steroidobacter denitrificans]